MEVNVSSEELLCIVDTDSGQEILEEDELRIVLIGRTGSGKSSLGNNILKQQLFESAFSPQSVTKKSNRAESEIYRKKIVLVDTPGFFHTRLQRDELNEEIMKSLKLASPGPHVVLYVSPIGRYSTEDIDSLKEFLDIFGENVLKYTIVVFVGKYSSKGHNIQQYLAGLPNEYLQFIQSAGGRHMTFDNRADPLENTKQTAELFTIASTVQRQNKSAFFTAKIQTPMATNSMEFFRFRKHIIISRRGICATVKVCSLIATIFVGYMMIKLNGCFTPFMLTSISDLYYYSFNLPNTWWWNIGNASYV